MQRKLHGITAIIILSINIAMYIYNLKINKSDALHGLNGYQAYMAGGMANGYNPLKIISAMFAHASLDHIFFNMMYFLLFYIMLKLVYSDRRIMIVYLLSGLLANAVLYFVIPQVALGASGANNGLIGMAVYMCATRWNDPAVRHARWVLIFAAFNTLMSFGTPQVSISMHITGFIFGLLISWIIEKNHKKIKKS